MLVQATIECDQCPKKFHQIDGTKERALQVVTAAMDRHYAAEHAFPDSSAPATESGQA